MRRQARAALRLKLTWQVERRSSRRSAVGHSVLQSLWVSAVVPEQSAQTSEAADEEVRTPEVRTCAGAGRSRGETPFGPVDQRPLCWV